MTVPEETVHFVSGLLAAERRRRGTRGRRRAPGCYRQAVLVLRWFCDGARLAQLAADNRIGRSTAYRYLHEGIDVLAATAPGRRGALLAARAAGHSHLTVDGTLIRTDRCRAPGPTGSMSFQRGTPTASACSARYSGCWAEKPSVLSVRPTLATVSIPPICCRSAADGLVVPQRYGEPV